MKQLKCDLCGNEHDPESANIPEKDMLELIRLRDYLKWFCPDCEATDPLSQLRLIPKLVQDVNSLKISFEKFSKKFEKDEPQPATDNRKSSTNLISNQNDMLHEFEERRLKERNLVFFGLELKKDEAIPQLIEFSKRELQIDLTGKIDNARSFKSKSGSQMSIIKFRDCADRDSVLRKSSLLRHSDNEHSKKIYINPDLTRHQQLQMKELRDEFKERREKGENIVIRGFQIVPWKGQRLGDGERKDKQRGDEPDDAEAPDGAANGDEKAD